MKFMKAALLSIILLFFAQTAWSATYYVSTSGNDRNAGTSNSPWQHCPGMVGWNGNAQLRAGDTVLFDSSGTWTGGGGYSLLEVVGGVIYDGRTWGNGTRATFKATGSFSRSIINIRDDDNTFETVVTGFHVNGNGQYSSGMNINWPSSVNLTGATKRIEDCIIHDVSQSGSTAIYGMKVGAVKNTEVRNVEILNNVVYNTPRTGINIYLAIDCPSCMAYDVVVRGNEIYKNGGTGTGFGIGLKNYSVNTVVEFNYIHDNSGHGISLENDGAPGPKNAIIRYNIIERCNGGINFMNSGDKSADVYGNLIYDNSRGAILFQNVSGANIGARFYNNTLYENASTSDNAEVMLSSANFSHLEFINNIIVPRSGKSAISGGSVITKQSNNITSNVEFKNTGNLPAGFKGTYGVDMEPDTDGFSIVSGSAIDGGINLGPTYQGAINLSGKSGGLTRMSQGSGWDVGAYEAVKVINVEAPVNLRVVQ